MSEKPAFEVPPPKGGVFNDLASRMKLIMRLLTDRRVNILVKLLPVASLAYLFWPIDLAIGPIDDALVLWLSTYLFVELCPPDIVEEHQNKLDNTIPGTWHDPLKEDEDNVINGQFRDVK